MKHNELIEYVFRKLDCAIGCAIQRGVNVTPNCYSTIVKKSNTWMIVESGSFFTQAPPKAMCYPYDLIIQGRKAFNDHPWVDTARYLMIPNAMILAPLEYIHRGMVGSSTYKITEKEACFFDIGKRLTAKYKEFRR